MFGPVVRRPFSTRWFRFADAAFGGLRWREAAAYLPVQVAGASAGAVVANLMFSEAGSVISRSTGLPGAFPV